MLNILAMLTPNKRIRQAASSLANPGVVGVIKTGISLQAEEYGRIGVGRS